MNHGPYGRFSIVPVTESKVATMVAVPGSSAVARPRLPSAFEIVAAVSFIDDHVTWAVRLAVELSL